MGQRSSGGNYPAITQEELGNILIPYVDLNSQEKIVIRINEIYSQAKQLQTEAAQILADAKAEVERMILGE
jgi:restriction endonuclease S subunit